MSHVRQAPQAEKPKCMRRVLETPGQSSRRTVRCATVPRATRSLKAPEFSSMNASRSPWLFQMKKYVKDSQSISSGNVKRRQALASGPRRSTTRMCGIFGIFKQSGMAAGEIYEALLMLQHRGQDSAGMVTTDGKKFREHKDNGLVKDVFDKETMGILKGHSGIGHVRYPTAGSTSAQEAQPFFVNSPLGIYMIHNGNLTNTEELRQRCQTSCDVSFSRYLRTQSDSEVLLNIFADQIQSQHDKFPEFPLNDVIFKAVSKTMEVTSGAYSVISLIGQVGMLAFRDPRGIRPLVLGKKSTLNGREWAFASEDCAFGPIGFERVRDVLPGEAILITEDGEMISQQCVPGNLAPCIFEYIYLARPDSVLNGISVYEMQLSLGRKLADRIKDLGIDKKIEMVVPVPDGSRPAAIEISSELNLPYREGLVKNRYVGRTFIMPDQRTRELSVLRKLNAMSTVFEGKRVLLVDDSIVRGTTMTQIVSMVRRAGAKKVYLASAAPPVKYPNVYGVDMPSKKEFIANNLTEQEVCDVLGADGLIYQTMDSLLTAARDMNPEIKTFDCSCFDGNYITGDIDDEYLQALESTGRGLGRTIINPKVPEVPDPATQLAPQRTFDVSFDDGEEEEEAHL